MERVLERYAKYNIRYDRGKKVIYIYRDIPVKYLVRLRKDLEELGLTYNDIIIEGR